MHEARREHGQVPKQGKGLSLNCSKNTDILNTTLLNQTQDVCRDLAHVHASVCAMVLEGLPTMTTLRRSVHRARKSQ